MNVLINLLSAYYNQDVWEEYNEHIDVWKSFINDNPQNIDTLKSELQELLKQKEEGIYKFIEVNSGGLSFDSPTEAKLFIVNLYNYISNI